MYLKNNRIYILLRHCLSNWPSHITVTDESIRCNQSDNLSLFDGTMYHTEVLRKSYFRKKYHLKNKYLKIRYFWPVLCKTRNFNFLLSASQSKLCYQEIGPILDVAQYMLNDLSKHNAGPFSIYHVASIYLIKRKNAINQSLTKFNYSNNWWGSIKMT